MRIVRIIATLLLVAALAYAVAVFGGCSTSGSGEGDVRPTATAEDEP